MNSNFAGANLIFSDLSLGIPTTCVPVFGGPSLSKALDSWGFWPSQNLRTFFQLLR